MLIHHALRMSHYFLELLKFLNFKQEQHVVLEDESVTGRHIDSLFESCLGILGVGGFFQAQGQVAESFLIVLFDVQGIEESDSRVFVIVTLELQSAEVDDRADVGGVGLVSGLEHFLGVETCVLVPVDKAHVDHSVRIARVLIQSQAAMLESQLKMLVVSLLDAEAIVCQTNIRIIMAALFRSQLRSFLVMYDALVKVFHNKCHSRDQLVK